MKKAFSTVACMKESVEKIIWAGKKYGMDGVEIRLNSDGSVLGTREQKEISEIGKKFRESGLVITDLGSSICITGYDIELKKKVEEIINYASILQTKGVRIFLGNFNTHREIQYEGILLLLKELCAVGKQKSVEIWVETHNEFSTGIILKKLIQDVACENLKIIWDIMHSIEKGEEIEETWNTIGDRIAHIHLKDGFACKESMNGDFHYTCLGEGALPLCGVLDMIQKERYKGYISFEWEHKWRPELLQYENTLEWVLKQYTDYLKKYKKNIIPEPGKKWERVDVPGRNDMSVFELSKKRTKAIIRNIGMFAAAKRYEIKVAIKANKTYRISVPYIESETSGRNIVYGVISMCNSNGDKKRRFYLKKRAGYLEYIVETKDETIMLVELGIKGQGIVSWSRPMLEEISSRQSREIKIASVYLKVKDITYEANLKRIEKAFCNAASQGADLIAFAETMNTRGVNDIPYEKSFETIRGRFCKMMMEKSREYGCYVFYSFREIDEYGARRNTAVLLNRTGKIVGKYHKTHLTLSEYEHGMIPGEEYPVFDTEFGKVGLLICWDTYFPEPARAMALQGAEILLVTTAGNPVHRFIARAKENGVYVVVSCVADDRVDGLPSTLIVDPCGNVLAETSKEGEAAIANIDLNEEKNIYWLALGPVEANPNNVYMNEYRDDLYEIVERAACERGER